MEKGLDKKLLLLVLKCAPLILGIGYFVQLVLSCFGVYSITLALLFGQSLFAILVLILCSIALGYCIWHRLPLYYIIFGNLLSTFDYYIGFTILSKWMLLIYLILIGILVLVMCLMENKKHVEERNFKKKSISNSW